MSSYLLSKPSESILYFCFGCSGQRLLEEFETHLTEEQLRQDASQDRLDKNSRNLTNIKTGMDHLAKKLKQVKAVSTEDLWTGKRP